MLHKLAAPRERKVPGTLDDGGVPFTPVEISLGQQFKKLSSMAGTGPNNGRNEYLKVVASNHEDPRAREGLSAHEKFGSLYANLGLPDWYYAYSVAISFLPIRKENAPESSFGGLDLRPVCMGCTAIRALEAYAVKQRAADARELLFPQQCAVGVEGSRRVDSSSAWDANNTYFSTPTTSCSTSTSIMHSAR